MAAFNLGTALEEVGEDEQAIAAYRGALRIDPMLADVHYHLSKLYQRIGHKLPALLHLKKYRELVGSG
jgi:tetratricopeptide (TPR) repeat protein